MTLTPFRGKRKKLRFSAYDLEWEPGTLRERLAGVYDSERGYRSYPNTLEFLRSELSSDNRGRLFFAHYGGMADMQFVLKTIIERANPAFRVKGYWSGSSLVICRISAGKNSWTFCDSFWLLRSSLAKLGKSLGLEKGGQDYQCDNYPACGHVDGVKSTCIFYAPIDILRDYNALDCLILYLGIERFEEEVFGLGGQLRMTVASTAMFLFRSSYLRRPIETSDALNAVTRDAYIASRVEVLSRDCGPADYYDINSSFPWSMTKPQPGEFLGSDRRYAEGDRMALVDADVIVPDYLTIPPLPVRIEQRVFFPVGPFRRWFAGEDLELLLDMGGRIVEVHKALHFAPFSDLSEYVGDIYERRKNSTDEFQRIVYKYLLNALYGKFGEGDDKSELVINPPRIPRCQGYPDCAVRCRCVETYRPGVYRVRMVSPVAHAHVPIAANITASSRALITRAMVDASKRGEVYYCDTDSVVTTSPMPTGLELGELKREKRLVSGTFLAPKLYRTFPGPEIRAKGFRALTSTEFDTLVTGQPIEIERMVRIRENFKRGRFAPTEETRLKRTTGHLTPDEIRALNGSQTDYLLPKRALCPNGKTRPWHVKELTETFSKG